MGKWQRLYLLATMLALLGSVMFGCQLAKDQAYTGFRGLHFGMTVDAAMDELGLEPSRRTTHELVFDGITDELAGVQDAFGIDRPYRLTLGVRTELTEPSLHKIEISYLYGADEGQQAEADLAAVTGKLRAALKSQRYTESDGPSPTWTKGPHSVSVYVTPAAAADDGLSLVIVMERDYASPVTKHMARPS